MSPMYIINTGIILESKTFVPWVPLQWCNNERDGPWNHLRLDCPLNRFFGCRSKKTSKLCVTCLCEGNSPVTGKFHSKMPCNAKNVSIWWRHDAKLNTQMHAQHWILTVFASDGLPVWHWYEPLYQGICLWMVAIRCWLLETKVSVLPEKASQIMRKMAAFL